jgi:hypothetical protein
LVHEHCFNSFSDDIRKELVAVESLPGQSDEQVTRLCLAGIGANASDASSAFARQQNAGTGFSNVIERPRIHRI